MTAEVRSRCAMADGQVVALFKQLFSRDVPFSRIAFSELSMRDLRDEYLDPVESVVIADEQIQGMPVLAIAHAVTKGHVVGTLLAINYGDCRLFTVL